MKIDCGDYLCRFKNGYIPSIRWERKSLNDIFGTLSNEKNYERFKKEIKRAKQFEVKLIIIIEGTLTDVLQGCEHSKRDGNSLVKQLFMLWEKYNVMPVFCSSREEMAKYISEFYDAIGRKALRDLKESKKKVNA